jgi:leucyl-tRNA synthetase
MAPSRTYDHSAVEPAWQRVWSDLRLNEADIPGAKHPYYNLMMFPYPSAEGLHVGNMYAFTGSDIHGRYMRMAGYDVFEPIGLDGFGIHSENYALKIGRNPKTHAAITQKRFYEQLHRIGAMFDWSRTLETYDPAYYTWTQWLFTEMFRHGLAYRGEASVNYCPSCKTVLADEQVLVKTVDGTTAYVCERCGNKVEKRLLKQWFFKITAYAEKLLENIPSLKWSDKVKTAQTNWIGKKTGINIIYPVVDAAGTAVGSVTCFTTRPDTNFGATFVVIAPEHPFVSELKTRADAKTAAAVTEYVRLSTGKSEQERMTEGHKKTGVATGLFCVNPLNDVKMPLYISDFVLMNFGTGAVVGVPAHDQRDFEFSQVMHLPVIRVVVGEDGDTSPVTTAEQVQEDEGTMVNSGFLDGMDIHAATEKIMDYMEEKGWGKRSTTYHLRDWTISRQRYWGPPIPMIYCETCAKNGKSWFTDAPDKIERSIADSANTWNSAGWYPVPPEALPVELPDIEDYKPGDDGIAPLAKHKEFYETVCPGCGGKAVRETDVSDTFLDSAWYFLRYPSLGSATESTRAFDPSVMKTWLPVHMYTGGAEHSVLHLLYSRFATMALKDMGYLSFAEPFANFYAHGLVIKDGAKMSKSKGNVVNPDEYIDKYGADALRLYLMFMGPLSDGGDFRDTAMEGMARWTGRIWRSIELSAKKAPERSDEKIIGTLNRTVARVSDDMPKRRYNTAIAAMMEFTNALQDSGSVLSVADAGTFLKLLAPFAPHLAEELWQRIHGRTTITDASQSVTRQAWPTVDADAVRNETIQFVIQVNGKVRDIVTIPKADADDQATAEKLARGNGKVGKFLTGEPRKTIFVAGRLINFVI